MDFKPIATGFSLLEAPRADERGIWFSDIVLGGVHCLRPDGRIDSWLKDRRFIGGLAFNNDGALICAGTDGLIWLDPATGAKGRVLQEIDGKPIRGINDMLADGRGGLFFGTVDHQSLLAGENFYGHSAICHLAVDGRVTKIWEGLTFANGIGISPDGRSLYFNDSSIGTYVCAIAADGSCTKGSLLSASADCDGLAVDSGGGIWLGGMLSGTITRLHPDGKVDRAIPVPGGHVTSLCFGGPDLRDVYITTAAPGAGEDSVKGTRLAPLTATLYHARADVPGVPVGQTCFRLQRN